MEFLVSLQLLLEVLIPPPFSGHLPQAGVGEGLVGSGNRGKVLLSVWGERVWPGRLVSGGAPGWGCYIHGISLWRS